MNNELHEPNEDEEQLLESSSNLMAACPSLPLRLIVSPIVEIQERKDTEVYMFNLIFLVPAVAEEHIKAEIEKMLDKIHPAIEAITIVRKH